MDDSHLKIDGENYVLVSESIMQGQNGKSMKNGPTPVVYSRSGPIDLELIRKVDFDPDSLAK
jgi:hypothetical protein